MTDQTSGDDPGAVAPRNEEPRYYVTVVTGLSEHRLTSLIIDRYTDEVIMRSTTDHDALVKKCEQLNANTVEQPDEQA